MKSNNLSRRNFIQKSALGLGVGTLLPYGSFSSETKSHSYFRPGEKLPREVWIASLSQEGMSVKGYKDMVDQILGSFEEIRSYNPDIICLPEGFPSAVSDRYSLKDIAETPIGEITRPFADYARNNNCYIICPIHTTEKGKYYNAAVVIDRQGKLMGEYRKIHPTIGEVERGIVPGPVDAPVFKTDFGIIGIQICFDIEWDDAWKRLRKKGAEMVFWASAYAGGSMVNTMAWQNKYCVVSSTRKDTSKICDISGEEIASTGRWNMRWVCAPVNLEKVFLHSWPYVRRFNEIKAKYGRKVCIKSFHGEEWSIIESRSPDVKVADIMKEFDLKSHEEHMASAEIAQDQARE
ncbi:carbon-nitrogen hydrolase family protein [Bacteroidota bacterium]